VGLRHVFHAAIDTTKLPVHAETKTVSIKVG
jgi:hypothetical protein